MKNNEYTIYIKTQSSFTYLSPDSYNVHHSRILKLLDN